MPEYNLKWEASLTEYTQINSNDTVNHKSGSQLFAVSTSTHSTGCKFCSLSSNPWADAGSKKNVLQITFLDKKRFCFSFHPKQVDALFLLANTSYQWKLLEILINNFIAVVPLQYKQNNIQKHPGSNGPIFLAARH